MVTTSEIQGQERNGKNISLTSIIRLIMQTKLGDTLNHAADELDDNLQKTNKKFREVHKHATEIN